MSWKEISDTSIAVFLFRQLYMRYGCLEQKISRINQNSWTYRLTKRFWEKIKTCFRYSFLARITQIEQTTPEVLENSRAVQYGISLYKREKNKATGYLGHSLAIMLAEDTKKELYLFPVKIISIVIIVTIDANVVLCFFLQRSISLWGWLMRGLLFSISVAGLFCEANWPTVKESSVLLRKGRID